MSLPVRPWRLLDLIANAVTAGDHDDHGAPRRRGEGSDGEHAVSAAAGAPPRDDGDPSRLHGHPGPRRRGQPVNQKVSTRLLESFGCHVTIAGDGEARGGGRCASSASTWCSWTARCR